MDTYSLEEQILIEAVTGKPVARAAIPLLKHRGAYPDSENAPIWEATQRLADAGLVLVQRVGPRVKIVSVLAAGTRAAEALVARTAGRPDPAENA